MSIVIVNSDIIIWQVSRGQTWCLTLSLVSVLNSPSCFFFLFFLSFTDISNSFVWHVCLPFTDISIMLIPNCTSGKDVYILATYTINRVGQLGPYTWFNPPKPGLQSSALCGTVCIINSYSTLLNWPLLACWFYLYYLVMFLYFSTWLYSML